MVEVRFSSKYTELWYPYGKPGRANNGQDYEGTTGYFADSENYLPNSLYTPRPDQAVTGL
ncbi:MAG TPA: hypothetical protein VIH90_01535 [Candidatus Saccharimonadales bacterium]